MLSLPSLQPLHLLIQVLDLPPSVFLLSLHIVDFGLRKLGKGADTISMRSSNPFRLFSVLCFLDLLAFVYLGLDAL
jgi:hypothetical protein